MSKLIDLTGMRFGRLTVIEQNRGVKSRGARWICKCDCGNIKTVRGVSLRRGETNSCGCLKVERAKEQAMAHITHGQTKTRLYTIWFDMKCRCHKESAPDFSNYGNRGITVCDEWRKDFRAFRDWAMANGYKDNLTLDRIDNDGNYCPENCRWADLKTQHNNTRCNHYVTYNGETLTIAQWSERCGINKNTLHARLVKYGWSVERALTERPEVNK